MERQTVGLAVLALSVQILSCGDSALAAESECSLDGKSIVFASKLCGDTEGCARANDRIEFVGDNVLLDYGNSRGVAAKLGRTIDLSESDLAFQPSPNVPGREAISRTGRVTASFENNILRIKLETVEHDYVSVGHRHSMAVTRDNRVFSIEACNLCKVLEMNLDGELDGLPIAAFRLSSATCKIENIPAELLSR